MITAPAISPSAIDTLVAVFERDPNGYGTLANAIRAAVDSARICSEEDRKAIADAIAFDWAELEAIEAVERIEGTRTWHLTDRGRALLSNAG
jgi:hypothetical protein